MKILLTGITGMIGMQLGLALLKEGHQLVAVTRNVNKAKQQIFYPCEWIECDLTTEKFSEKYCKDVDAVIHLAGDNIGSGLWTKKKKKSIYDSRINSTENLTEIFKTSEQLKVFINMSASGFYSSRSEGLLSEKQSPGSGFLSEVCKDWELALSVNKDKGYFKKARIVFLRTSMVLAKNQGALSKILLPYLNYVGVKVGSPELWMSWIHLEDFISIILFCLKNENIYGPINCSSPEPVLYKDFYKGIETNFFSFFQIWIPQSFFRLMNKSMVEFLYSSQRLDADKILKAGFLFKFDHLYKAFENLFESHTKGWRLFETAQYISLPTELVSSFFSDPKNLAKINLPSWRFKNWQHTYQIERLGTGTVLVDQLRYRLPFAFILNPLIGKTIKIKIAKKFSNRANSIKQLLG